MGKDHTLYSLVEGHVKFTTVALSPPPPPKGVKWIRKTYRKFVNVVAIPKQQYFILKDFLVRDTSTV